MTSTLYRLYVLYLASDSISRPIGIRNGRNVTPESRNFQGFSRTGKLGKWL